MTVLVSMAAVALVVAVLEARRSDPLPAQPEAPALEHPVTPSPPVAPDPKMSTRKKTAEEEAVPFIDGLVYGEVDLREARAVMPDNLYWQLAAPTKDPAVLEAREEEKKRRNEEYGRVLSGDANEDQVNAYYDYRERISTDFLEFAEWMSNRYGDKVDDQFRGLLDLSVNLHKARLAEISRDREDALARSREREKIREDWRREQEEFNHPAE
ncbi:MAG TPA: hypothetical protein VFO62_00475 [Candidatus Binatia bacterium]|nr:hypothetical protein [Candidatus Binatia bacterium]